MTLHLHCWMWWPIVRPPSGAFLNCQKGYITGALLSPLLAEPNLGGTPGLPVLHLLRGISHKV